MPLGFGKSCTLKSLNNEKHSNADIYEDRKELPVLWDNPFASARVDSPECKIVEEKERCQEEFRVSLNSTAIM